MGAQNFENIGVGKTAEDAFRREVDQARSEYGSGGYTGTIAEKREFKMVRGVMSLDAARQKVLATIRGEDSSLEKYMDKWDPCGCIEVQMTKEIEKQFFWGNQKIAGRDEGFSVLRKRVELNRRSSRLHLAQPDTPNLVVVRLPRQLVRATGAAGVDEADRPLDPAARTLARLRSHCTSVGSSARDRARR